MLKNYLFTFLLSMVPVIELRGAIPYGLAHDLEPWLVYALSVVGNLLPVPFILLFVRRVLAWMKTRPRLCRLAEKIEARAKRSKNRRPSACASSSPFPSREPARGRARWSPP